MVYQRTDMLALESFLQLFGFLSPTRRCKSWHTVVEQCGEPIAGSLYDASIAPVNGVLLTHSVELSLAYTIDF